MKIKFLALVTLLLSLNFVFGQKDVVITKEQLPKISQQFIDQHFTKQNISYCIKDHDSFDVKFENGYEVDFDKKGEWKEIDCNTEAIPLAIIPASIQQYVNKNFPQCTIVKIERDHKGYDIELNNNLDIEFDKKGNFKKIDI